MCVPRAVVQLIVEGLVTEAVSQLHSIVVVHTQQLDSRPTDSSQTNHASLNYFEVLRPNLFAGMK